MYRKLRLGHIYGYIDTHEEDYKDENTEMWKSDAMVYNMKKYYKKTMDPGKFDMGADDDDN